MKTIKPIDNKALEQTLNIFLKNLDENIAEIKRLLTKWPDNQIRIIKHRGRYEYYLKSNDEWNYLNSKNDKKLTGISNHIYYSKVLSILEEERSHIASFLNQSFQEKLDDCINIRNQRLQNWICTYDDLFKQKIIDEWKATTQVNEEFRSFDRNIETKSGLFVRSKSERMIADIFDSAKVNYIYEPELKIGSMLVHPDFYILNDRTFEVIIYEHFGMMDDPRYANDAIAKIKFYENHGFKLGVNLIVTFENSNNPLNPNDVYNIIRNYLR